MLSFSNTSGDQDNAAFNSNLAEDISAALTRFTDVFVVSGDSTRRFEGENVDPREIGRALGVSYVLAGSIRRSQDYLRVTARIAPRRGRWTGVVRELRRVLRRALIPLACRTMSRGSWPEGSLRPRLLCGNRRRKRLASGCAGSQPAP